MPGEGLLEAAGQNFKQAGDTAIESQNARTKQESVDQEPRLEETRQIGETVRKAMGDKTEMKKIQEDSAAQIRLELLKHKMGETTFPPEVALQMSKRFKMPALNQMGGKPIDNRVYGGMIMEMFKQQIARERPRFEGNMMIATDEEGNEVMTDMTKHGFFYRPGGSGGSAGSNKKMTAAEREKFIRNYHKEEGGLRADQSNLIINPNDADLNASITKRKAFLQDNRPDYDEAIRAQKEAGGIGMEPADNSGGGSGSDATIDEIYNAGQGGQ